MILDGALQPIQTMWAVTEKGGVPARTLRLVHLRASRINGCSVCIDGGVRIAEKNGESHERLLAVAAWRDAPYFSEAERAALALTEAVTRPSDRPDPVPDDVRQEAARRYDERGRAALVLAIATATVNELNRVNVATRQVAGTWKP